MADPFCNAQPILREMMMRRDRTKSESERRSLDTDYLLQALAEMLDGVSLRLLALSEANQRLEEQVASLAARLPKD